MKYPLYLLAICVSLFSCKTIKLGTIPSPHAEPFVQLKNGEVIKPQAGSKGTVAPNKKKDALVVDGRKVDKSSVAFYSDGDGIYAATSDDGFAKKIAEGKINVYNKVYDVYYSSYNPTTHTYNSGMRTVAHYYIQDSNSKHVSKLNYDNLYQMIPEGTRAASELQRYRRTKVIGWSLVGVASVMFIGGAYMAGDGILKDKSDGYITAGVVTMFTGMAMFVVPPVVLTLNKRKLHMAIGLHNGTMK
jgi:hypothetical protein